MTSPVMSFALQSLSVFVLCVSGPTDYMAVRSILPLQLGEMSGRWGIRGRETVARVQGLICRYVMLVVPAGGGQAPTSAWGCDS